MNGIANINNPTNKAKVIYPLNFFKVGSITIVITTIITLRIGTDRPLQTVYSKIRCRKTRCQIRVYMVCHTYSNIQDTSTGSRMNYFNFLDKNVK